MTKKKLKPTHGGKREGAGRTLVTGEKKKAVTIRLYPKQKKAIEAKYGTVQKAVDTLT